MAQPHVEYAYEVMKTLRKHGYRIEVDDSEEKLGKKIRQTQMEKIPYMLVVGDKEVESGTVPSVLAEKRELGSLSVDDFIAKMQDKIDTKTFG